MSFRRGRRFGVDVGSVRVGIASCDPDGILATPAATVYRRDGDDAALRDIAALLDEYEPIEIVCGQPRSLDGQLRQSASTAWDFTVEIAKLRDVPVRLVDERFTTTQAHSMLQSAGKRGRQRRETVDAAAAVLILQSALDYEKSTGSPAGTLFEQDSGDCT